MNHDVGVVVGGEAISVVTVIKDFPRQYLYFSMY
jgi:hypothetical protein